MPRIRSKSFWSKYQERVKKTGSLLCIGLDSDLAALPQCVLSAENPILQFNREIINATLEYACAYKPNLAFYIAAGIRGMETLLLTIAEIPEDIPVILDCKAGDIGNTMQAYLKGFFNELGADAVTINPLMGRDVLEPLLGDEYGFAFVLAVTSNPSAKDFLLQKDLYKDISLWVKGFDHRKLGAVVGATQPEQLKEIRKLLPEQLFLIPGIGAQGGDLESVLAHGIKSMAEPNILINSSRGIIFADRSENYAQAAAWEAKKLKDMIQSILNSGKDSVNE